jgi:hypothetical protein
MAIWQKYPNPFASHVLSSDVIDRYIDQKTGVLYTTRLLTKKGKLPSWGAKLFNMKEAYILETSSVDPVSRKMITTTRNLSHKKILLVQEQMTITELAKNATLVSQKAKFVSNTSFVPIRSRIEKWGFERFQKTSANSLKGLVYILDSLSYAKI